MTDGGMDQTEPSMKLEIERRKRKLEQESYSDKDKAELKSPTDNTSGSNVSRGLNSSADLVNSAGGGSDTASASSGILTGAGSGAAVGGMVGGPMGAAVGAGVGATIGTIGALSANKAKRKALARQIESEKYKAIGEIRQAHGQQEAAGLQNMIAGLRSSFLR